ncbi:MAG: PEGA domain-containing protein [Vicinamibacterales bacterium]
MDGYRNGGRSVVVRPRVVVPGYRAYNTRPYPRRTYVAPYGYRPYGYRQGWNVDLYFGRPFGGTHVYAGRPYGYYALAPGFAHGALRIVDAPRSARVFVDGYYAGEADDYDGLFQRLNLEAGSHQVEIEVEPGFEPLVFDVRIVPGETVTIHVDDRY